MTNQNTPISTLGEFGLIERIKQRCGSVSLPPGIAGRIIRGIDDDTAVIKPEADMLQLVTSDLMVEGIHFDLTYTSFRHLGWKLMVVNLSDIAAMGGIPLHALISIALPAKISVEMVDAFYEGVTRAAETYRCAVVGGDTNTTLGNMIVSATITGEIAAPRLKLRSAAKPGDKICVSGDLGLSHAGLKILVAEKERFQSTSAEDEFQPDFTPYAKAVSKHLSPRARFDVAEKIAGYAWLHAMIDISDGLASDLRHICKASATGADIDIGALAVHDEVRRAAEKFSDDPLDYVLFGGEEYELLFTVAPDALDELGTAAPEVRVIGTVTGDEGLIRLVKDGEPVKVVSGGGYDHFTGTSQTRE